MASTLHRVFLFKEHNRKESYNLLSSLEFRTANALQDHIAKGVRCGERADDEDTELAHAFNICRLARGQIPDHRSRPLMPSKMIGVLASAQISLAAGLLPASSHSERFHWVQYGPDGLQARVITDEASCPVARLDGVSTSMTLRAAPSGSFPISVCSKDLPAAARSLTISDVPAPTAVSQLNRIAVIGDTGCRIEGSYVQPCNDPQQWPFPLIAEVVAHMKPDLVIHVGDYYYRETPCPASNQGCAGSPHGDTWAVWRTDFFAPADTLLKVAPWVFVRGNHEVCDRGGEGWSRALDPRPFDVGSGCQGLAKPYAIRLAGLTLAVMDVSSAREEKADEAQVPIYRAHYRALAEMTSEPAWIVQHRPIWSAGGSVGGNLVGDNKTLAAAAAGLIPDNVAAMLSGHHHLFQVLSYASDLPVQIVSGHGGDYLNQGSSSDPAGWVINGVTVKSGVNLMGVFGFAMLERRDDGWQVTTYSKLGAASKTCVIKGRVATCAAE